MFMGMNKQLRAARKRKHWSQWEAAQRCHVTIQTFHRWEQGRQIPHGANLELLCRAFDMTMEELGYSLEEGVSTPQPEVLVDQESYLVQFSLAGAIQIRRWKHFEKLLLFSKRFFLPATRN